MSKKQQHKVKTLILVEDPHIKSRAAYILLHKKLYTASDIENDRFRYLKTKGIFLEETLKEKGFLECAYCHRKDLVIGTSALTNNRIHNLATIDHIVPISKGGDYLDPKNWAISCKSCNGLKGSDEYLDRDFPFVKELRKFEVRYLYFDEAEKIFKANTVFTNSKSKVKAKNHARKAARKLMQSVHVIEHVIEI